MMTEFITTIKVYIAIVGGTIAGLIGGCDMILKALICFVCGLFNRYGACC